MDLKELNTLRDKLGQHPLKRITKHDLGLEVALARNEVARRRKRAEKTKKVVEPVVSNIARLIDIAKSCKVSQRTARQKFRRLYQDGGKGLPSLVGDQWAFALRDVPRVKKLLEA